MRTASYRERLFTPLLLAAGITALLGQQANAQTPAPPLITQVLPAGGQAGTAFEVKVTGQGLEQVEGLHFGFPGTQVEVLGTQKPGAAPQMQRGGGGGQKPANVVTQLFKVTLPKDAPRGFHDVRVLTKAGISNSRTFVVSDHMEIVEEEPNDDLPKAQRIALETSIHGVIAAPTDVDYFVFTGKKGQRIVCSCLASSIDSKLPAAVQLYSASGTYLGIGRGYLGSDALLDVTLPADGDYHVRVFSFSYTLGGPDYFYRLTVSKAPWIDAVYPPAVEPGKEAHVTIYGRNLPGGTSEPGAVVDGRPLEKATVTIKAPASPEARQRLAYSGLVLPSASALDGFEYHVKNEHGVSNAALVSFARAPVVLDNEKNDTPETAQQVSLPCQIAGRIEKKDDRDWYAFSAKKGEVYSIEANAERLGAPVDLYFQVRDGKGNAITEQDDNAEILSNQFFTRSDDPPRYRFVVPADGTYQLMIASRDSSSLFGPRHLYTVRITPEEPDFRVIAMPPSLTTPEAPVVGQGGTFAYNLHVWREDGFNGDITLTAVDLPPGLSVPPQIVSAGQKPAVVVIGAAPDAAPWAGALHLKATAEIQGRKVVRDVRAAAITWAVPQQNIPAISRLEHELVLAVRGKAPYRLTAASERLNVLQGESIKVPVKVQAADLKANVQIDALGLPSAVKLPPLTLTAGKEGTIVIDTRTGLSPGNYTLVLRGQTQPQKPNQPPQKNAPPNLVEYTTPVTLTVVPKQLIKLTVTPSPAKVQLGKQTELIVRAARQTELALDYKVDVVLPPNAAGISVPETTLKAGQDETKLIVSASPQAMPGTMPTLTVRATALFNGSIPVVHEAKVPLSVMK